MHSLYTFTVAFRAQRRPWKIKRGKGTTPTKSSVLQWGLVGEKGFRRHQMCQQCWGRRWSCDRRANEGHRALAGLAPLWLQPLWQVLSVRRVRLSDHLAPLKDCMIWYPALQRAKFYQPAHSQQKQNHLLATLEIVKAHCFLAWIKLKIENTHLFFLSTRWNVLADIKMWNGMCGVVSAGLSLGQSRKVCWNDFMRIPEVWEH